jgi:hypothetical protein
VKPLSEEEREGFEAHVSKKNSLCFWYPYLVELGLPAPRTLILEFPGREDHRMLFDWVAGEGKLDPGFANMLKEYAGRFGYPLFMRTDAASNKFEYQDACVVNGPDDLIRKFGKTIEFNEEVEVAYNAIVFRELLKPDYKFTAYKGMPVTRERRYFARDGQYVCHHPYWFEDVITDRWHSHNPPVPDNWKELLAETNREMPGEVELLKGMAERVTLALKDYWSVDFLYANNQWWITDMALGKASFHYPHKE